jgi:hypothetical protein
VNGALESQLFAVTCTSTADCWAVGRFVISSGITPFETLTEHWDGISWSIIESPNRVVPGEFGSNFLLSVACTSASDCWAVGYYFTGFGSQTLVERWDGSSWTIVPSPNDSSVPFSRLNGVSCASASDCWAVGWYTDNQTSYQALTEHWDGSAWTIVAADPIELENNGLMAVTCLSASNCWAVGYSEYGAGATGIEHQALIEHWDGTSWARAPLANLLVDSDNGFFAVTCVSETSVCWAAGVYGTGPVATSGAYQTLIERWDATTWPVNPSVVASPNTSGTEDNWPTGVACASTSECWAVGYFVNDPDNYGTQALIEQWNPSTSLWSIVASPNTGSPRTFLNGVACVSRSDCWAVGYATDTEFQGPAQTLVQHYGPMPAVLIGVVSRKAHANAGTFDINLPLTGNVGVECRSGGAGGSYTIVFTFANALTNVAGATVTSGTGLVGSSSIDPSDAHNYIVNLTDVTNAQTITVSLTNVTDSAGNFSPAVAESMRVLVGDTNGDGFVNSADIGQTKSQSGQSVTSSNFREDVNADGFINSADIGLVKSKSGTAVSP